MILRKVFLTGLLGATLMAAPVFANDGGSSGNKPAEQKHGAIFTGQFTAVDAAGGSVTVQNKQGEAKSVTIGADTKIEVNGKPATLADVKVGMYGGVKLNADNATVFMVKANDGGGGGGAKHSVYTGKVTAIEGANLTLASKDGKGTATYAIPAGIPIQLNGKPATFADAKVGMHGAVKLGEDAKTVLEARFYEAK